MTDINWGYNCLTSGIHHGRPEALWNLPQLQATSIFSLDDLGALIVARIYNDAMQYVEHDIELDLTQEWAERVREVARTIVFDVIKTKQRELKGYYASSSWQRDISGAIELIKQNKLNSHYQPLHHHDSINMLCRIVGQSATYKARPATS